MKIYDQKGLPNPMRVRVAAAEKGVTERIEFVPVDVLGGEHKQAAFLAINPGGFVPVLELDDGRRIVECAAITEYIDHMIGEPVLTGRTTIWRARPSPSPTSRLRRRSSSPISRRSRFRSGSRRSMTGARGSRRGRASPE